MPRERTQEVTVKASTHARYAWCVEWRAGGKRRRAYVGTERAAKELAKRKRAELALSGGVEGPTPAEVAAVLLARERGVPLREAVLAWLPPAEDAVTVAELIERRREAMGREGLSSRYAMELEQFLRKLERHLGGLKVAEVTAEAAAAFVFDAGGGGARTIRKRRVLFGALWNFAESRGLAVGNPVRRLKTPKLGAHRVALLSPEESHDYLLAVACVSPAALAVEAVAMFAGLRRAELERLLWDQVWLERELIEVGAAQSKTRMRRLVTIEPALHGILSGLPKSARTGRVLPVNHRRLQEAAMERAGWGPGLRAWPVNALRHGFVSYHLALYHDVGATELQSGHDKATLFRNYRELVTPEAAARFWSVTLVSGRGRVNSK